MTSTSPVISVIVPVYNTEKWVGKCIDSICVQTFTDFELIMVDDGSTDGSGRLCDEYASRDLRIQTIHTPNNGVSLARNAGLAMAQGQYVVFIDSDDWVENDYLSTLLDLMGASQFQLGICGILTHPESGAQAVPWTVPSQKITVSGVDADMLLALNQTYLLYGPVNKIYDRRLIADNRIYFDSKLTYGEDLVFNFQYLEHVKQIAISERPLYHYQHDNAVSLSKKYYPDKFEIDMRLFEVIYSFFEKRGLMTREVRRWLWTRYFWCLHDSLFLINHLRSTLGILQKFHRVRGILAHPLLPEALAFADTDKCPRSVLACIRHRSALGFFTLNALIKIKNTRLPS